MATITSAATGNWSAGATWVGGVPPTSVDDAVIGAGHTVTLDVDATVISLSGAANTASNLSITTSRTFTCTGANGITGKAVTNGLGLVRIETAGITVNINSIIRSPTSNGSYAIHIFTNICTVNIVGDIINANTTGAGLGIYITSASTLNITGNVIHLGTGSTSSAAIWQEGLSIINITGNVTSLGLNVNGIPIRCNTTLSTLNITGNVTANLSNAVYSTVSNTVTVVGTITASNSQVGINMSSGNITISTPCLNASNGLMAVLAFTTKIYSTSVASWLFKDESNNDKYLYSAGVALGNPAEADVRNGTTYGASSELTGTLIVPSPSNVVAGVQTDNTVGTYSTTPALIATEIFTKLLSNSDFNTAGSFGKLIKDNVDAELSEIKAKTDLIPTNPASVQSVGAIVASYNV
jgi:hypothetical protein